MKKILKRSTAMLLTLIMMISILPSNLVLVNAAEGETQTLPKGTSPTEVANDGLTWVAGEEKRICDHAIEHTHSASCYLQTCNHENGEHSIDNGCYGIDWGVCTHTNPEDHTETKLGSDMSVGDAFQTEAYSAKLEEYREEAKTTAGYQTAYNTAYNKAYDETIAKSPSWAPSSVKELAAKAAGKLAGEAAQLAYITEYAETQVADDVFCAVYDESDLVCTHVCNLNDYSSECYTKICLFNYEHTHVDACYEVTWTHKADINNNEIADDADTYYTVSFDVNGGEGNYEDQSVLTGMTAESVADPTRTGYTFSGWSPAINSAITKETTFVAQWDADEYDVTWKYEDGTIYITTKADYDSLPVKPADPELQDTAEWDYTFVGWTPDISKVDGTDEYTAIFSAVKKSYTITFMNDGEVLQSSEWEYGTTPVYEGKTPTKADDEDTTYTFAGWDSQISTVTGEKVYTATFSDKALYDITFVQGNGQADITDKVEEDEVVNAPADPVREGYRFTGWYTDEACTTEFVPEIVSADTVIYAGWIRQYTVTFASANYTVPSAVTVDVGTVIFDPGLLGVGNVTDNIVMTGWYIGDDKVEFPYTVSGDVTIVAVWEADTDNDEKVDGSAEDPFWTVTYVDGNGNVLYCEMHLDGTKMPVIADPTYADHSFAGWDSEVADTVTNNVTYTATWIDDANQNKVDDKYETITVVVDKAADGDAATINGTTTYIYDSTKGETVTITAKPVVTEDGKKLISTTYVSTIVVNNGNNVIVAEGYADNYTYTYELVVSAVNGAWGTTDGSKTVTVTFEDAKFVLNDERLMNYYDGMPNVTNKDVYDAIVAGPAYNADNVTITYKAREAMTHSISVDSLDISDTIKNILKAIGVTSFDFDMKDLWMDVNVEVEGQVKDSVSLEVAVSTYLTSERINGLLDTYNEAFNAAGGWGGIANGSITAGYEAVKQDIAELYDIIYAAAMYYEAHNFGYNATEAETVTEAIKVTYASDAYYIETVTDITLKDMRGVSVIKGNDVELVYKDYTDEDLFDAIGAFVTDADGNVIKGAEITCVEIADPYTFEGKNVSEVAYEITVKFAGNEDYKPSEKTFTVTITKAPVDKFDIPDVNVFYGEDYSMAPDVVLGNKYGATTDVTDSMIQFIVGLDVADLDVNADGVTGLNATVQLILPTELQDMLDKVTGSDSTGMTMTLSQLMEYLQYLPTGSVASLESVLNEISQITEAGDIMITIGGTYPTDIGVYLVGAVTTSSNYDTAWDVAYLVIKPQTEKHYLKFNYVDENSIFSQKLLQRVDLNASAYDDEAHTVLDEDATAKVQNLFVGVDEEGNFVSTLDSTELGNGVYAEIAFLAEWGNVVYYAEPIVRPVIIVPNIANIEIVDENGNANDIFEYIFDNTDKVHYVTVDGEKVEAVIRYYGIQTNTELYDDTAAPKHAGAYTAVVTYVERNAAGEIVAVGGDVAAIVIKPADSSIEVTDEIIIYDGEGHAPKYEVTTDIPAIHPDVTIITGSLFTDGDVLESGINALEGNVNVDFPNWLDTILSNQYPEVYTKGITATQLIAKLTGYVDALVELGVDAEVVDSIISVLEQLPKDATLTFENDIEFVNTGAYLSVAVVTDSDFNPSVDYGVVVITTNIAEVTLVDANANNAFLYTYDKNAHGPEIVVTINGEVVTPADGELTVNYVGVTAAGVAYNSSEAPTEAGTYAITVTFVRHNADGTIYALGATAGAVTIEKAELVFDLLDTTVTFDNLEQFVEVNNELSTDYVAVIIDRENNVGNILLEGDMNALVVALEEALGRTLPTTLDVAELLAAINEAIVAVESSEYLTEDMTKILNLVKEVLATLPQNGTININDELPVNVGTYEVYAATYSANYKSEVSEGTLEIKPVQVVVEAIDNEKFYGTADPELTYDVKYYDHEGNELTNIATDVVVEISREEGENAGDYVISLEAAVEDTNFEVVEVIAGTLTIIQNLTIVSFTMDKESPQTTGSSITLNVEAIGGTGEYTYKYAVLNKDTGTWYVLQDFGSNSSYTAKLTTAGEKEFAVTVKDSAGTTVTTKRIPITVIPEKVELGATLLVDGSTEAISKFLGSSVTLSVDAIGGSGEYTYRYAVLNKNTGCWFVLQDFGSNSSYTTKLSVLGAKEFAVTVKDSTGKTVATKRVSVTAIENPDKLSASLQANGTTEEFSMAVGSDVMLSVDAKGGSGEYTYQYAVLNKETGSWHVLQTFSSNSTYKTFLRFEGAKEFAVTVKDSTGKTVAANRVKVTATAE